MQINNVQITEAEIYSANGKMLKRTSGNIIDLSEFSSGVYFLKFQENSLRFRIK
jgi:hypothetical protein